MAHLKRQSFVREDLESKDTEMEKMYSRVTNSMEMKGQRFFKQRKQQNRCPGFSIKL